MLDNEDLKNPRFSKRGYIQIYHGLGKGKTTCSMGLAVRALGHGWRVLVMQFVKGGDRLKYGEYRSLTALKPELVKNLKYKNCGLDKVIYKANVTDEDRYEAQKGFFYIIHNYEQYDLIVLDEINIAVSLDLIHLDQLKDLLRNKPKHLEIVLTGREAHPDILEMAHLVTEMQPEKHYYKIGVGFRKGIEI